MAECKYCRSKLKQGKIGDHFCSGKCREDYFGSVDLILTELKNAPNPLKTEDLARLTKIGDQLLGRILQNLERARDVFKDGRGNYYVVVSKGQPIRHTVEPHDARSNEAQYWREPKLGRHRKPL